jgi:hypothetical protein
MATYRLNMKAFGEHVLNASWMVQEMRVRAEKAKAFAESIAPVGPDAPHYKDSFEVSARPLGGAHKDRAEAVLSNTSQVAVYVEFGNVHIDEHAVLRKALGAVE